MWCPKCKNEYIDGVETCVDCGIPLVQELTPDNTAPYEIPCPDMEQDDCCTRETAASPHVYIEKEAVYEDSRSTAFTLLLIGFSGLLILALIAMDVIHLNMESYMRIMMFLVMGTLFLIFIIIGLFYQIRLKTLKKEAIEEAALTTEILDWFFESCTSNEIDHMISDISVDEEQLYFARYEILLKLLMNKYPNLKEDYADHVIEKIYCRLYH